jgi:DNA-directed RNA polymerase specialized sigma24 family protein
LPSSHPLILSQLPLVERLARQLKGHLPAHVEVDDLIGDGHAALCYYAGKYDPARAVPLTPYLIPRLRGAMIDGLRLRRFGGRRCPCICLPLGDHGRELIAADPPVGSAAEKSELVCSLLGSVSTAERQILERMDLQGQSGPAAAADLGITEVCLYERRRRAIRFLRDTRRSEL